MSEQLLPKPNSREAAPDIQIEQKGERLATPVQETSPQKQPTVVITPVTPVVVPKASPLETSQDQPVDYAGHKVETISQFVKKAQFICHQYHRQENYRPFAFKQTLINLRKDFKKLITR